MKYTTSTVADDTSTDHNIVIEPYTWHARTRYNLGNAYRDLGMLNSALVEFKAAGKMDRGGRVGEEAMEQVGEVKAQLSELRCVVKNGAKREQR